MADSSSESEEDVRPRRVKPEPVFEAVSASRSQIQHELQMMRRQMAMRAMFQAPALWINEPLDPALPWHDMETKHKSGLKFLHEAIQKANMTWTKGHGKC